MAKLDLSARDIYSACICLGVHRAARAVARRYDDVLRSIDLTSGQFSILSALLGDKPTPISALADLLGLDRTTLNRNLRPLEGQKLVETVVDPDDRRVRGLRLTTEGRKRLALAIPLWRTVQSDSTHRIGRSGWSELRPFLDALARPS